MPCKRASQRVFQQAGRAPKLLIWVAPSPANFWCHFFFLAESRVAGQRTYKPSEAGELPKRILAVLVLLFRKANTLDLSRAKKGISFFFYLATCSFFASSHTVVQSTYIIDTHHWSVELQSHPATCSLPRHLNHLNPPSPASPTSFWLQTTSRITHEIIFNTKYSIAAVYNVPRHPTCSIAPRLLPRPTPDIHPTRTKKPTLALLRLSLPCIAIMKRNDVIAVIIIVLFVILAGVSFGIWKLVSMAKGHMSVTSHSGSSSGTGTSRDIAD